MLEAGPACNEPQIGEPQGETVPHLPFQHALSPTLRYLTQGESSLMLVIVLPQSSKIEMEEYYKKGLDIITFS